MLKPETLASISQFWSSFFGIKKQDYEKPGVRVFAHHDLKNFEGIFLFKHHQICLASVPKDLVSYYKKDLEKLSDYKFFISQDFIRSYFSMEAEHLVGAAGLFYVDKPHFKPVSAYTHKEASAHVRKLTLEDQLLLEDFAHQIDPADWKASRIELEDDSLWGAFKSGNLAALASFNIWEKSIARAGVVTHPRYRGKHLGSVVLNALVQEALSQNMIVQYRTLLSNIASVKIAQKMGFYLYGETTSFRINRKALSK